MTEALAQAFKQVERLSAREQQEIAQMIEQKRADMCWETLWKESASTIFLRALEQEAEDESALEDLEAALCSHGQHAAFGSC